MKQDTTMTSGTQRLNYDGFSSCPPSNTLCRVFFDEFGVKNSFRSIRYRDPQTPFENIPVTVVTGNEMGEEYLPWEGKYTVQNPYFVESQIL